jgi:hypothetical protein
MRGDPESFDLAKRMRAKQLADETEMLNACACEFPLVRLRNMHCHGSTIDGKPCPAIAVWQRHRRERAEAKTLASLR